MSRLRASGMLLAGLAAVLVVGIALPAGAQYSKVYRFTNNTGVAQTSVSATTSGLELITMQYAYPSGWIPARVGYAVISGVFCTRITFGGGPVGPAGIVTIGWRTSDYSCRLRDLRWGSGRSVVPTQLCGTPGGGEVIYDYPNPGDLTVAITNDNTGPDQCLTVPVAEWAVSGFELNLQELGGLTGADLVELRVAAIARDIAVLRDEIEYYALTGDLPSPSATSLLRRLDRISALIYDGLAAYLDGDLDRALFFWKKAGQQNQNFISEVTNMSDGNLAQDLYDRWIVDGDGQIATAPEIGDAIAALPEGQPLQSLPPLPPEIPPILPGLSPDGYREWPVAELCPGEWTAFVLRKVDQGEGFVLRGWVIDANGDPVLDWVEQAVAEPAALDVEPPVIEASATPDHLWPPDHTMIKVTLEVTISDDSPATWYLMGVQSNQPEDGLGDGDQAPDWWRDPDDMQSLWLRAERSGNHPTEVREYTITLGAVDMAGNVSAPCTVVVPVVHDQG